jgi:long-chain acyl-CoA synthetase
MNDLREIGPTYYFAPPSVFENLLTQVMIRMEDASRVKRWIFNACMDIAKRCGADIMDDKPVGLIDRLKYALGGVLVYGPLRNNLGMSQTRVAYTGGAAIGPDLYRFYRSLGINLKQLYGQTETAAYVCKHANGESRLDTVGKPLPGVEIKIADKSEIWVKSPGMLKEYYKAPEATVESISADGYFMTGDAGFIDGDGHLKIIDRAKDVGKLNDGTMFAPQFLENKLKFFPFIKEAVCFGDGRDVVCAFLNIEMQAVANWAERNGLPYAGYVDLAGKPEVYALLQGCVDQVNADLAQEASLAGSQIRRFLILHKELDADDDELTRTRKVRRGFVEEKYAPLVSALFDGAQHCKIETQVKFEDGRSGTISADLVIRDVKLVASASVRQAA